MDNSAQRVKSALIKPAYSAVIKFPDQKITVNLFSATYAAVHINLSIVRKFGIFSATYAAVHYEHIKKNHMYQRITVKSRIYPNIQNEFYLPIKSCTYLQHKN